MTILVTGGAGFIGSNFVHEWLALTDEPLVNLDKRTYAGNVENLVGLADESRHFFIAGDIADRALVASLLKEHRPRAIINFAAESHVDRSISQPAAFIHTNLVGTFELLEAARGYWISSGGDADGFRFLHVSTDEVYGSLSPGEPPVREDHPYAPGSPYSASKAGSDHLVRAYHNTYGLPTLITNCSNNYGPRQHPEKLIPLSICNALAGCPLPVYGNGLNVRDWLFVSDHCAAIRCVLERGTCGHTYNIGGGTQERNIDVVERICSILGEIVPLPHGRTYRGLITYVADRPGHDLRYALNTDKIRFELGWEPAYDFETGLRKTVSWYIDNRGWVEKALTAGRERGSGP